MSKSTLPLGKGSALEYLPMYSRALFAHDFVPSRFSRVERVETCRIGERGFRTALYRPFSAHRRQLSSTVEPFETHKSFPHIQF